MGKTRGWEEEGLISELTQGMELTKQLKNHLDPLASPESRELLLQKIISSYDKALSMLNWEDLVAKLNQVAAGIVETPQVLTGASQRTEASDQHFKDQYERHVHKKRKTLPRWTEQMRVRSETGTVALDDGYSWRKYGQKYILGAKHPRAYYRCTHRHGQGCLAMKQLQKSDEDPSIVKITYRGTHTCIQPHQATPALASIEKEIPKQNKDHAYLPHLESENQTQPNGGLFEYEQGLGIKIEDLRIMEEVFPSFSFPSTPIEPHNVQTNIFSDSVMENNFLGSDHSPAFISPETSESDYFSRMPRYMDDSFGLIQNLQHSGSDLTEIISAPTSVTNSPMIGDLDFSLDQVNLDPNFPLDTLEFLS